MSDPLFIAAGPDGNLWFTEFASGKIGKITPAGSITETSTPTGASSPVRIAVGPDGALWFTEQSANKIGRVSAPMTETALPNGSSFPNGITVGSDARIWFTEEGGRIGARTNGGVLTEYSSGLPASDSASSHHGRIG